MLRHRALKSDVDDDDLIENDNVSKFNMAVQLSLKRPNRVNNESGHMQKKLKVKKSKVVPTKRNEMKKLLEIKGL